MPLGVIDISVEDAVKTTAKYMDAIKCTDDLRAMPSEELLKMAVIAGIACVGFEQFTKVCEEVLHDRGIHFNVKKVEIKDP